MKRKSRPGRQQTWGSTATQKRKKEGKDKASITGEKQKGGEEPNPAGAQGGLSKKEEFLTQRSKRGAKLSEKKKYSFYNSSQQGGAANLGGLLRKTSTKTFKNISVEGSAPGKVWTSGGGNTLEEVCKAGRKKPSNQKEEERVENYLKIRVSRRGISNEETTRSHLEKKEEPARPGWQRHEGGLKGGGGGEKR